MSDDYDREEDELQHRQNGRLYPVGRSLRSTFPPADGEDLQPKITTLMVELAHQPYEEDHGHKPQVDRRPPTTTAAATVTAAMPAASFLQHLGRLFRRTY